MADLISRGLDWLNTKLAAVASQAITYVRSSSDDAELELDAVLHTPQQQPTSILGWSPNNQDLLQGNPINTPRDFSVLASDLVIGSVSFRPEPGDQIKHEEDDGTEGTYEVMALQSGGLPWEFETGHRGRQARIRIHTKYIGEVATVLNSDIDIINTDLLQPPYGVIS